MAQTTKMGRPSIFEGKVDGKRVQAIITQTGGRDLDKRRVILDGLYAKVMQEPLGRAVTDAEVVEFLARGEKDTIQYLKAKKAAQT